MCEDVLRDDVCQLNVRVKHLFHIPDCFKNEFLSVKLIILKIHLKLKIHFLHLNAVNCFVTLWRLAFGTMSMRNEITILLQISGDFLQELMVQCMVI